MNRTQADDLIAMLMKLVERRHDLRAMAVCGSWARGSQRADSDIDILLLATDVTPWRTATGWIGELPFGQAGLSYAGHRTAAYGVAWSAHIQLQPAAELELTFVLPSWADTDPVDPGSHRVVTDGFRICADKDGRLTRLVTACVIQQV